VLGRQTTHPNLIQVWAVDNGATGDGEGCTRLCYCVGLSNRGTCFKVKWCPMQPPAGADIPSVIGLLAVVCGDGSLLILQLPTEAFVTVAAQSSSTGNINDSGSDSISHKVLPESCVCKWTLKVANKSILSVDWNPHNCFQLICGMNDGSITLWNIHDNKPGTSAPARSASMSPMSDSSRLLSVPDFTYVDATVNRIHASLSAVSGVRWCPYNPQLFASTGFDGQMKVHTKMRRCYYSVKCVLFVI
jgi:WD40 repeat protein